MAEYLQAEGLFQCTFWIYIAYWLNSFLTASAGYSSCPIFPNGHGVDSSKNIQYNNFYKGI
jgi:hypothetical protein